MKISPTARQRFSAKYRVDAMIGCWLWSGAHLKSGYGLFGLYIGRNELAHRASWMLSGGSIPDGMYVCHRCDTPACVNPDHLFLGTGKDNMQDALAKGRCFIQPKAALCKRGHAMVDGVNVRFMRCNGARRCLTCEQLLYSLNRDKRLEYLRRYRLDRKRPALGNANAG